jgi:hypothetical protein
VLFEVLAERFILCLELLNLGLILLSLLALLLIVAQPVKAKSST